MVPNQFDNRGRATTILITEVEQFGNRLTVIQEKCFRRIQKKTDQCTYSTIICQQEQYAACRLRNRQPAPKRSDSKRILPLVPSRHLRFQVLLKAEKMDIHF